MGFFDSDVEYQGAYNLPTDYNTGLTDVLGEAKKLYESKKSTGFQTYPGERIAGFTPEEQAAMTGISSLVGAGSQYFDPARDLAKGLGEKFTADTAQSYMNPYQQSVVDVEKRKAREDFGQTMQDIGSKAVGAGSFGGSRQAIVESEAASDLGQRLGDIQSIGTKAAFDDARKAFEAQKGRERLSGSALASLGQQAPQQALKELTALAGVGEAGRGMEQSKYDMTYQDFLDRQNFAGDALGDYAGMLYGFPTEGYRNQSQGFAKPSSFQNLMGLVSTGAKLFGGFKEGGHIAFRSGGGLSGMYYPEEIDQYAPAPEQKATPTTKENVSNSLLSMMNLGSMSSDLTRLQELRTKIAEAKAQKEMGKDTFMGRLGEFAQGVAGGFDPTRPQSMAGSLAAGAGAIKERQDPEIIKAQTEAEGLESGLKTKQVMAELTKDYLKAIKELSNDIEGADFNNIEDAVYKSFGFTLTADGKLQGIGGKPVTEQQQLQILKKQAEAIEVYKSKGYEGLAQFLAQGEVKPKDPNATVINNPKIQKFLQPNKV